MKVLFITALAASDIFMVLLYNAFVRSRQRVAEAWSGIEVQLKRRANLIPNLVETVKTYASHERRLFQEITEARSSLQQARSPVPSAKANEELSLFLGRLLAVAENYPQLRASENFTELQQELFDIEEKKCLHSAVLQPHHAGLQYPHRLVSGPDSGSPVSFSGG